MDVLAASIQAGAAQPEPGGLSLVDRAEPPPGPPPEPEPPPGPTSLKSPKERRRVVRLMSTVRPASPPGAPT